MQDPKIKNLKQEENSIILELIFPNEAEYFQGHFPEIAILPGVVQVHYAMFFAVKYIALKPQISNIKKLRFSNIIEPNKDVSLFLKYETEVNQLSFKYFSDEKIHSSGTFYLS